MYKKMKLKDIHITTERKKINWFTLTPRSDKLKLKIMVKFNLYNHYHK